MARQRPFRLDVDSGSREEPPARYFGSFHAALRAMNEYPEQFRRFAWIVNVDTRTTLVRNGKTVVT